MKHTLTRAAAALALLAAVLGFGAGLASTGSAVAQEPIPVQNAAKAAAPGTDVNFLSMCRFSHRGPDDPIVYPMMPGRSHMHDFFGNRSTGATSNRATLLAAPTLCRRTLDTAAYWTPSLLVDGQLVAPSGVNAYYRTGGKDPASIEAFPAGLKIIAGDAKATAAQDRRIVAWGCRGPSAAMSAEPPMCVAGDPTGLLKLRIRFPDCWNGRDLDSADHKSHMAYSVKLRGQAYRTCPASHPAPVPSLALNVRYPVAGGAGVALASGGVYSGHADFFNAWDQAELERLVERCLNANIHCGGRGPKP